MHSYNSSEVEAKWQKYWQENNTNKIDLDSAKKPFYNLMMFPYPSAEGMHIGGMYTFTGVDTYGRFKRMQGFDVFEPMGLDSFGIHSENYALKIGEHIKSVSKRTHKHFFEQLKMMGNIYDWERIVETNEPNYYRWTQWLFTQLFKSGLAYRKKALVKYCPACKTVVSDEQVIDGKCERCNSEVESRELKQWFFKITKYADRLYENLKTINWDADVKLGQKNWIGKKKGINITYQVKGLDSEIVCFTTRPDTNFGATFIVLAPEHSFVKNIIAGHTKVAKELVVEIKMYVDNAKAKSDIDRIAEGRKKTGVFTGFYAINGLNNKEMPIYISDFVLGNFGTGAVVGVPGHDKRDFEFAKEFDLEVIRVVAKDGDESEIDLIDKVLEEDGVIINSDFLNGLRVHEAIEKAINYLEAHNLGKRVVSFNLRDWCVSRQRYWGPPIPMIYCKHCAAKGNSWFNTSENAARTLSHSDLHQLIIDMAGWYPVEELPVLLPDIEDFEQIKPDGSGKGPLAQQLEFVKTTCPYCSAEAERETDVSDPFVDSCWYFLRYPFTEYDNIPFGGDFANPKSQFNAQVSAEDMGRSISRMKKWGPVTSYIGGKEHTVLHLLYARFITMVMKDLGYIDFEEPFTRFFGHGLITKDGAKMSKSKGNVVNPDEFIAKYGADAVRLYLRFIGPFDASGDWRDSGMHGMNKFVNKLWSLYVDFKNKANVSASASVDFSMMHRTIKEVGSDLDNLKFNTAVAKIMEYVNWYGDNLKRMTTEEQAKCLSVLALIIAPLAPHIAEEFWSVLGNNESIHKQAWPEYDATMVVAKTINLPIQVNGKVRATIEVARAEKQDVVEAAAKNIDNVEKHLAGKQIRKVIYIQDKIINFIV